MCMSIKETEGSNTNRESGERLEGDRQSYSLGFASLQRGLTCRGWFRADLFLSLKKICVIKLARWNLAFVNNSLMFHPGDNIYCQICRFTTLLLKTKHTTLKTIGLRAQEGPILPPREINQYYYLHHNFFLRKKIRAIMLFLTLAPLFCRC